jgi:hypothetical protein
MLLQHHRVAKMTTFDTPETQHFCDRTAFRFSVITRLLLRKLIGNRFWETASVEAGALPWLSWLSRSTFVSGDALPFRCSFGRRPVLVASRKLATQAVIIGCVASLIVEMRAAKLARSSGRLIKYPWIVLQPAATEKSNCADVSTPSTVVDMPRHLAIVMMARTIAALSASWGTCRTETCASS